MQKLRDAKEKLGFQIYGEIFSARKTKTRWFTTLTLLFSDPSSARREVPPIRGSSYLLLSIRVYTNDSISIENWVLLSWFFVLCYLHMIFINFHFLYLQFQWGAFVVEWDLRVVLAIASFLIEFWRWIACI